MDMIFRYVTTQDLDLVCITDFSDAVAGSYSQTTSENSFMVLRRPDQVVLAVKDGVAGFSV
jgi:hypothetical protein